MVHPWKRWCHYRVSILLVTEPGPGAQMKSRQADVTGRTLLRAWCLQRNIGSVGERATSSIKVFDGTRLAESNRPDQIIQILNRVGACWPHVISAVQSQDPCRATPQKPSDGSNDQVRSVLSTLGRPYGGPRRGSRKAIASLVFPWTGLIRPVDVTWGGPSKPATEFLRTRVPGLLSTAGSRSYSGENSVGAAGESRHLTSRWRGAAVGSYPFGFGAAQPCRHGKMPRDSCGAAGAGFHGQKWSRSVALYFIPLFFDGSRLAHWIRRRPPPLFAKWIWRSCMGLRIDAYRRTEESMLDARHLKMVWWIQKKKGCYMVAAGTAPEKEVVHHERIVGGGWGGNLGEKRATQSSQMNCQKDPSWAARDKKPFASWSFKPLRDL